MHILPTSVLALVALCGPALADAPATPVKVKLSLKGGATNRAYDLQLTDQACARSEEKTADHSDKVKVCARDAAQNNVRLDVEWETQQSTGVSNGNTSIIVARGATAAIANSSAFRLDVAVQ